MIDFTIERTVAAPVDAVFARLTDHRAYASMTPLRRSELEREGEPAPNGVGAVRRLSLAGPPMREEVIAYEAPGRFAYRLLSGLPVRDHVGDVRLSPDGPGRTRVVYRVTSTPTLPFVGPVVGLVLRGAIAGLLRGVAKAAENGR
jgi:uncharacterized protein YndB with AHSA1/START domain